MLQILQFAKSNQSASCVHLATSCESRQRFTRIGRGTSTNFRDPQKEWPSWMSGSASPAGSPCRILSIGLCRSSKDRICLNIWYRLIFKYLNVFPNCCRSLWPTNNSRFDKWKIPLLPAKLDQSSRMARVASFVASCRNSCQPFIINTYRASINSLFGANIFNQNRTDIRQLY